MKISGANPQAQTGETTDLRRYRIKHIQALCLQTICEFSGSITPKKKLEMWKEKTPSQIHKAIGGILPLCRVSPHPSASYCGNGLFAARSENTPYRGH